MGQVRWVTGVRSLVVAMLGALVATSSALAVPTPVSPADGATVASTRPKFTWTWDAGTAATGYTSVLMHVTDRPTVDAAGGLERTGAYREIYYAPALDSSEPTTTYRPPLATALTAGTHYWQVSELNTVLPTNHSPVRSFEVPGKALIRSLSGSAQDEALVTIKAGFTANSAQVAYRIEYWRGGRRRGMPETGFWDNTYTVGAPTTVSDQFSPRRLTMRAGERYTVKVRITAGGVSHTRSATMFVRR